MPRKKLEQGDVFTIAANLLPVYGVWFLGWNAVEAFIVYALETLLVGALTLIKMAVVTIDRRKDTWYNQGTSSQVSGLFFMAFFTVHYGIFAAVQSSIFAGTANISPPGTGMMHFFTHWYTYINQDIALMLGAFVVSYLARSFVPFIVSGEYKTIPMMKLMFQPYGRIFIQQFTVILGSFFLMLGLGKGFILVFAIIKLYADLYLNFEGKLDKVMTDMVKEVSDNEAEKKQKADSQ